MDTFFFMRRRRIQFDLFHHKQKLIDCILIISFVFSVLAPIIIIAPKHHNVEMIKIEHSLLECDHTIKSTLQLTSADPDKCLVLLSQLKALPVTSLMLKKNPHCVETIKRLRRYVGNTKNWKYSDEEKRLFNEKAERVRKDAIEIYNKFKVGLFIYWNRRRN